MLNKSYILDKKCLKAVMDVGVAEIVIFGFPPAGPNGVDEIRVSWKSFKTVKKSVIEISDGMSKLWFILVID